MPRRKVDFDSDDFKIHVDESCLSAPMDDNTATRDIEVETGSQEAVHAEVDKETAEQVDSKGEDANSREEEKDEEVAEEAATGSDTNLVSTSEDTPPADQENDQGVDAAASAEGETETPASAVTGDDGPSTSADPQAEVRADEEPVAGNNSVEVDDSVDQATVEEEPAAEVADAADQNLHKQDYTEEPSEVDQSFGELNDDDEATPRPAPTDDADEDEEQGASRRESTCSDRRVSLRTEALIQATARAVVASIEEQGRAQHSEEPDEPEADRSILSTTESFAADDDHEHSYLESVKDSRRESEISEALDRGDPDNSDGEAGGDSSSQHDADDDVFSDNSPRSSIGSIDAGAVSDRTTSRNAEEHDGKSHSGNGYDVFENGKSARISGISEFSHLDSQMDEDDAFVPETRGTPRQPFRTTSSVRGLQMSSPAPSIFSTPRSSKRPSAVPPHSAPRLGSPGVSAQYSPKGRSTPTRFKVKKESAPLVLLHTTLLPLQWAWADVLDDGLGMVPDDAAGPGGFKPSEELKRLRDNWRELQNRMGDTVLERGILLPHPQSDYEVLEERLLEALELPMRRRARILECGHYIGPSNIASFEDDETTTDESEDDYALPSRSSKRKSQREQRHWCGTCKSDIKLEALGAGKVFRVKVYASNGLMRAGAWEACWKEMERVDVEVEPIVEPALQGELERLAAWQAAEHQRRAEFDDRADEELMEEAEAHLAADQNNQHDHHDQAQDVEDESAARQEMSFAEQTEIHASPPRQSPGARVSGSHIYASSPPPMPASPMESHDTMAREMDAERRRRDEERLREIYGHSPSGPSRHGHDMPISPVSSPVPRSQSGIQQHDHRHSHQQQPQEDVAYENEDSFIAPPSSISPSQRAYERRRQSTRSMGDSVQEPHHPQGYDPQQHQRRRGDESLPELLLEAARVLMRDRKNAAIVVLSFLVLVFAVRAPSSPTSASYGVMSAAAERDAEIVRSIYMQQQQQQQLQPPPQQPESVTSTLSAESLQMLSSVNAPVIEVAKTTSENIATPSDPCSSLSPHQAHASNRDEPEGSHPSAAAAAAAAAPLVEKKVVRVYETVTETVRVTATENVAPPPAKETASEVEVETVTETMTVRISAETEAPKVASVAAPAAEQSVSAAQEEIDQKPAAPELSPEPEIVQSAPLAGSRKPPGSGQDEL